MQEGNAIGVFIVLKPVVCVLKVLFRGGTPLYVEGVELLKVGCHGFCLGNDQIYLLPA